MTPLVVTPGPLSVEEVANLVLSDGTTDLNLLGTPPWGLYLVEFTPPIVPRENLYVRKPEGQSRKRSQPNNAVGNARVRIDRQEDTSVVFAADVDSLQGMVESAHKRKGTLTFTPPNLQEVTYDIESCQITEALADGPRMTKRILEFVIEFECKPYGRLATETLLTDEPLTGPIDGVEIPSVNGHVDALAELTITDSSGADADFVEFGIVQQGYDPDAALEIDQDDINISGYEGTQPGGSGTPIVIPLTTTPVLGCATATQTHGGRQKVVVLLNANTGDIWVRLRWHFLEGQSSYGRWVEVENPTIDQELTLAVIDIGEADARAWAGELEAFIGASTGTLSVSAFYIVPAEVCGRIRWSGEVDDSHALFQNQSARFTHEAAYHENATGARFSRTRLDGDTLRIPASTAADHLSLLVVRRRLYDIDSGLESDGRDADVTATLEITPRVALY